MTDRHAQETGCPHDFGVVRQCPTCRLPRSLTTSESVTRRYLQEQQARALLDAAPQKTPDADALLYLLRQIIAADDTLHGGTQRHKAIYAARAYLVRLAAAPEAAGERVGE